MTPVKLTPMMTSIYKPHFSFIWSQIQSDAPIHVHFIAASIRNRGTRTHGRKIVGNEAMCVSS